MDIKTLELLYDLPKLEYKKDKKGRDYLLLTTKKYSLPNDKNELEVANNYFKTFDKYDNFYGIIIYAFKNSVQIKIISCDYYKKSTAIWKQFKVDKDFSKYAESWNNLPWNLKYKIRTIVSLSKTKEGRIKPLKFTYIKNKKTNNRTKKIIKNMNKIDSYGSNIITVEGAFQKILLDFSKFQFKYDKVDNNIKSLFHWKSSKNNIKKSEFDFFYYNTLLKFLQDNYRKL